jgi:hypothetical protein
MNNATDAAMQDSFVLDGWIDGWMSGLQRMDGVMDGWMDGFIYLTVCIYCMYDLICLFYFSPHLYSF